MAGTLSKHVSTRASYHYDLIWNNKGSKAKRHVSFWQSRPEGTFRPMGSLCCGDYDPVDDRYTVLMLGYTGNAPENNGILVSPTGYTQVWTDKGSSAIQKGSLWRPVPPSGYVALGHVAQTGYDPPSTDLIWCLREDFVTGGSFKSQSTWSDQGSGATKDVSVWEPLYTYNSPDPDLGYFQSILGYFPPNSSLAVTPKWN